MCVQLYGTVSHTDLYNHWSFPGGSEGKNLPAVWETWVQSLDSEDPRKRAWHPTLVFLGFPGGSDGKESICNVGDSGSIPGSGSPPGGGHGTPLQYSCLENPVRQATVHGVAKSQTQLKWLGLPASTHQNQDTEFYYNTTT